VAAVNFRGCSGVESEGFRQYHLGFTDDLRHFIQHLHEEQPDRNVYLSGFSLGGNVICKCLGELAGAARDLKVRV
jgi:predicted alpha/beta-fold hydrolase